MTPLGSCLSLGMLEQVFGDQMTFLMSIDNQLGLRKRRWNLAISLAEVEFSPVLLQKTKYSFVSCANISTRPLKIDISPGISPGSAEPEQAPCRPRA